MEAFDTAEPGFGGFLPWFCSRGVKKEGDGAVFGPFKPAGRYVSAVFEPRKMRPFSSRRGGSADLSQSQYGDGLWSI